MKPRTRVLAFGVAAALVLAGAACGLLVNGVTGDLLTLSLLSVGLVGAVLLVFLEVGLSEDRERARNEARPRERARDEARPRERAGRPAEDRRRPPLRRRPRRRG
ncbi:MAG: hypothetical protein M3Z33_06665 [Actinomycetota bacterium]|nr:hypothetical protein [Actinomycetota bacterium]